MLSKHYKIILFYVVSALFLALNIYFVVQKETLLASILPLVLAIVLVAIVRLDSLLLLVTFFTPISLPLHDLVEGLPFDMFLPTEPLLFGILILFLFKLAERQSFEKDILTHPISLALYFYLGWMLITAVTSTMPIVSLKFWLSKLWFLAAFYFMGILLFRNTKNIYWFVGLYCGAFVIVIFYAWARHFAFGFHNDKAAHFVMNPFYKDHTSYGAMLAFFIPILIGLTFSKSYRNGYRLLSGCGLLLFTIALILSYTRAAWLSLVIGGMVWLVIKLKLRFRPLFITGLSVIAIVLVFQTQILMFLERNNQESSADLATHLSSMTNVTTDASNLERINRWSSALQMFEEKPVLGWGPGTYMFQYAPFQLTKNRTIISTNSADGGNAHSEYLGPLAESGFLGALSFILLVVVILYVGIHAYSRSSKKEHRMIILSAIIGLVTYLIHGFLNNFLDTDKASIPFWGFVAILVVFDLQTKLEQKRALPKKKLEV
ncbi:O-antigen ligase family protein [Sunxiuqinia indica]|uniref:O-antigen ligase family protein n=1 Tax=Sunxiuqinia indica TaxID=2692584 RepID=UPI00135B9C65|nr:O-antigen ligase family protein [Sunxiuqinia indica]